MRFDSETITNNTHIFTDIIITELINSKTWGNEITIHGSDDTTNGDPFSDTNVATDAQQSTYGRVQKKLEFPALNSQSDVNNATDVIENHMTLYEPYLIDVGFYDEVDYELMQKVEVEIDKGDISIDATFLVLEIRHDSEQTIVTFGCPSHATNFDASVDREQQVPNKIGQSTNMFVDSSDNMITKSTGANQTLQTVTSGNIDILASGTVQIGNYGGHYETRFGYCNSAGVYQATRITMYDMEEDRGFLVVPHADSKGYLGNAPFSWYRAWIDEVTTTTDTYDCVEDIDVASQVRTDTPQNMKDDLFDAIHAADENFGSVDEDGIKQISNSQMWNFALSTVMKLAKEVQCLKNEIVLLKITKE